MNHPEIELYNLLKNRITDILFEEAKNQSYIHLYNTGKYWVAFEKSAFNLWSVYPKSVITPMLMYSFPFPIVMASVKTTCLHKALQTLSCEKNLHKQKIFQIENAAKSDVYQKWHRQKVRTILLSQT